MTRTMPPGAALATPGREEAAGCGFSGAAEVERRLALVGLSAGMALTAFVLWHLGRNTTFFYDEWDFVMQRRSGGLGSILRAHNGHLNLVSATAYRALFAVAGLRHYGAFRAMVVLSHLACCGLVFIYIRRRAGDLLALAGAASLLAAGRAWEDLLWPFQMALILSVAAGVAALCLLDRNDRQGDVLAAAAVGFSLASFSFGIPVVAGVGVELGLRREWKRWWVPVAPAVGYGLWYLRYGGTGEPLSRPGDVLPFTWRGAEAAVAALCGSAAHRGGLLLIVFCVTAGAVVVVRRGLDRPRVALLVTTLVAFWLLTGLTRATTLPDSAGASRYIYVGAAYLVLLLGELARGWRIRPLVAVVVLAVTALAAQSNAAVLRAGAAGLRDVSTNVKAELAAVEILGSGSAGTLQPDNRRMPQVRAGAYLAAVKDLGSPADSPAALQAAPDGARQAADAALAAMSGLRLEVSASRPPAVGCAPLLPAPAGEVLVPAGELRIAAAAGGAEVRLRRFGSFPTAALGHLAAGQDGTVTVPKDRSTVPWRLGLTGHATAWACGGAGHGGG